MYNRWIQSIQNWEKIFGFYICLKQHMRIYRPPPNQFLYICLDKPSIFIFIISAYQHTLFANQFSFYFCLSFGWYHHLLYFFTRFPSSSSSFVKSIVKLNHCFFTICHPNKNISETMWVPLVVVLMIRSLITRQTKSFVFNKLFVRESTTNTDRQKTIFVVIVILSIKQQWLGIWW